MEIFEAHEAEPALMSALARLLPQLNAHVPAPTAEQVRAMLQSGAAHLLVARHAGEIVGCLVLVVFRTLTATRGCIEDVVVDGAHRGQGIGEALNRAALARAVELGAGTVDLTSHPSREAANRLYRRIGFVARATNIYRWTPPR